VNFATKGFEQLRSIPRWRSIQGSATVAHKSCVRASWRPPPLILFGSRWLVASALSILGGQRFPELGQGLMSEGAHSALAPFSPAAGGKRARVAFISKIVNRDSCGWVCRFFVLGVAAGPVRDLLLRSRSHFRNAGPHAYPQPTVGIARLMFGEHQRAAARVFDREIRFFDGRLAHAGKPRLVL